MSTSLERFYKKRDRLICIDSDGCAMDTMDIKHIRCFGPCIVEEWGLFKWEMPILKRWNDINLYTVTRGINRFKGLAKILTEIDALYCKIEDIEELNRWVEESDELSNPALEEAITKKDSICLKKALAWSEKVNEKIDALSFEEKKPFEGVKDALAQAYTYADIAVVSSANLQAVEEEWERYQLLEYVDIVLTQNIGSKAYCIRKLLEKGYEPSKVMMIGDSMGDYEAASQTGVFYYPILVRREKESWKEFCTEAVKRFVEGSFQGEYQEKKVKEFKENLE